MSVFTNTFHTESYFLEDVQCVCVSIDGEQWVCVPLLWAERKEVVWWRSLSEQYKSNTARGKTTVRTRMTRHTLLHTINNNTSVFTWQNTSCSIIQTLWAFRLAKIQISFNHTTQRRTFHIYKFGWSDCVWNWSSRTGCQTFRHLIQASMAGGSKFLLFAQLEPSWSPARSLTFTSLFINSTT